MKQRKYIAIIVIILLVLQSSSCYGMHFFREGFHAAKEWWDDAEGLTKAGIFLVGAFTGYVLWNEYRINRLKRESKEQEKIIAVMTMSLFDQPLSQLQRDIQLDEIDLYSGEKRHLFTRKAVLTYPTIGKLKKKFSALCFEDEKYKIFEATCLDTRYQVRTLNWTLFGKNYIAETPPYGNAKQLKAFLRNKRALIRTVLKLPVDAALRASGRKSVINDLDPFDDSPTIIRRIVEPPGNGEKEKEN